MLATAVMLRLRSESVSANFEKLLTTTPFHRLHTVRLNNYINLCVVVRRLLKDSPSLRRLYVGEMLQLSEIRRVFRHPNLTHVDIGRRAKVDPYRYRQNSMLHTLDVSHFISLSSSSSLPASLTWVTTGHILNEEGSSERMLDNLSRTHLYGVQSRPLASVANK